jgi:hypothetical protein
MKNTYELIQEANELQKKRDKTSWVFYFTFFLILSPCLTLWITDYAIFTLPLGFVVGLIWSTYDCRVKSKQDRLRVQAHKQYGSDEEEY